MAKAKPTAKKKQSGKKAPVMIGYKGFDKNLQCRGYQYEIGKEHKENSAFLCDSGLHFCEFPLDVFRYYPPANGELNRFAIVETKNVSGETSGDSKRVAKRLTIKAEIGLTGLIKAGADYILEKASEKNSEEEEQSAATNTGYRSLATNTGYRSAATNTGNWSAATNTGDLSVATNTGDRSVATNTGDRSVATNTGYLSAAINTGNQSVATNTGDRSVARVEGKESIAMATGIESKASGSLGCWIVLAEWEQRNDEFHVKEVKSSKVDGKIIKADVFYVLKGGEFVECEDGK